MIDWNEHERLEDCVACWPGHPKPCDCGGLIHAVFVEDERQTERMEPGTLLDLECDKCHRKATVVDPAPGGGA